MQKNRLPDRCKPCQYLSTGGRRDGIHDRWCCHFGQAAAKVQAQCLQSGAFRSMEDWRKGNLSSRR